MYLLGFNETTTDVAIIPRISFKISFFLLRVTRTMSREFLEYLWDKLKSFRRAKVKSSVFFFAASMGRREASDGINGTRSYPEISLLDTK